MTLRSSDDLYLISSSLYDVTFQLNTSSEIIYDDNYIIVSPIKIDVRAFSKFCFEVSAISTYSRLDINVKSLSRDLSSTIEYDTVYSNDYKYIVFNVESAVSNLGSFKIGFINERTREDLLRLFENEASHNAFKFVTSSIFKAQLINEDLQSSIFIVDPYSDSQIFNYLFDMYPPWIKSFPNITFSTEFNKDNEPDGKGKIYSFVPLKQLSFDISDW